MLEKLIGFFTHRHLLANMIVVAVFVGALVAFPATPKEEMPDFSSPYISISVIYPGAAPQDVERLVTRKIETELKGIDGVLEIRSTSTEGRCSITIEFQAGFTGMDEALNEIRSIVNSVKLPAEVRDAPSIRRWKISQRAIIDIGLYLEDKQMLDTPSRLKLQQLAYALENQLSSLPDVSEVSKSGYLKEEIQINLIPAKLRQYNISVSEVLSTLDAHNLRQPAGSMDNHLDTKISLVAELDTIPKLNALVVRSGFDAPAVRLGQIAEIRVGFEKNTSILKVNGREAIVCGVKKTSSTDIITATRKVIKACNRFRDNTLKGTSARIVLLDDDSTDVRNRLSLIGSNGLLGFVLILITLLIFMDARSAFWVAMGIPFTFFTTMIIIPLIGYTVNNITLAAIIIVMGMIVDDAIVVAENVSRRYSEGEDITDAAVKGTAEVFLPIIGSIITTVVAFIPLYFIGGRYGVMSSFIPAVVMIMLFASLFESTLILPGHLTLGMNNKLRRKKKKDGEHGHWFFKVEHKYGNLLIRMLRFRWLIIFIFIGLLVFSAYMGMAKMKYVMFPQEEVPELTIMGNVKEGTGRRQTAVIIQQVEEMLRKEIGRNVVGFRSSIARSRRGGAVNQNEFSITVELVPTKQRKETAASIRRRWSRAFKTMKDIVKIRVATSRFGQSSGSPIVVEIHGNDPAVRSAAAAQIADALKKIKGTSNIEIEEPFRQAEYRVDLKRDLLQRLDISPTDISKTIRTLLQGTISYELNNRDEEVDVRVSIPEHMKRDIDAVLNVPVQNKQNYLVPLRTLVTIEQVNSPTGIERKDFKQVLRVYSDLRQTSTMTPLVIADKLESTVFPQLLNQYPNIILKFGGEIKDTRESGGGMKIATILVIGLILGVLMLLFNGLSRPLVIMIAIPFGTMGIILTFLLHGIYLIGLFTAIGALGLAGVVVNDSIVLVDKLDNDYDKMKGSIIERVARIVQTRLRAVLLTTLTTVAGIMPTAYGVGGYDSMLAEMMLALSWGLLFGTATTLIFVPCIYTIMKDFHAWQDRRREARMKPALAAKGAR